MHLTHFGISVENVLGARDFYCDLFELEIYVQEAKVDGVWRSLDPSLSDQAISTLGFSVGMAVLQRDTFAISVQETSPHPPRLLEHAGVALDRDSLQRTRARVLQLELPVIFDRPTRFVFVDIFGMVWELTEGHLLLTAKDMGYGYIDAEGRVYGGSGG